jgi:hypothetical protein
MDIDTPGDLPGETTPHEDLLETIVDLRRRR